MKLNKEQKKAAMNSLLLNPMFMKKIAAQGYTPIQLIKAKDTADAQEQAMLWGAEVIGEVINGEVRL